MRKNKKTLALLTIVAMVLTIIPLQVFATDNTRLAGADRIATAIAIADAFGSADMVFLAAANAFGSADTVILAAADDANLVDSLAVAPLAGKASPIYLTYKNSLDAAVKAKLSGKKVIVVGAISAAVVDEVKTVAASAEKVSGADRLATNDLINAKLTSPAGTFVVGYDAIPDALSIASFAAANNYAIVLANPDGSVAASKLVGSKVYIIGGPTLVQDIAGATRLYGKSRFATNQEVIKSLTYSYNKVYIANGISLVDALAASSLAAKTNSAILLTDSFTVRTASEVNSKTTNASRVIALGGTSVVSDDVKDWVFHKAPAVLKVESINVNNAAQLKVVFNEAVDRSTAEDIDNYSFSGLQDKERNNLDNLVLDKIEVQDDGVTALITLLQPLQKIYSYFSVEINNNIKDLDGNALETYKKIVELSDQVRPNVKDVKIIDRDSLEITFSEPVKGYKDAIKINNGTDDLDIGLDINDDVVTVSGLSEADAGNYTLVIKSSLADMAGNIISPNPYEKDFSLTEDDIRPIVTSLSAISKSAFKVVFSEPVNNCFSIVINDEDVTADVKIKAVDHTNNMEFYVSGLDEDGLTKVTIDDFQDKAGNKNGSAYIKHIKFQDNELKLTSTAGTRRIVNDIKYAIFTYNQDLNTLNPKDLKCSDGEATINKARLHISADLDFLDDDQLAIALGVLAEGTYTVTLPAGLVEAFGACNAEEDVTFTYTDGAIDVFVNEVKNDGNYVYVNFIDENTEPVEMSDSALNLSNYQIEGKFVFKEAEFTDTANNEVKLTLRDEVIKYEGNYLVEISNIKDTNGHVIEDYSEYVYFSESE